MITDRIIEFFLEPLFILIEKIGLPEVDIVISNGVFDVLSSLGYFLPMNHICICLAFSWALDSFNIIWALILRIKSFASVNSWLRW